MGTHPIFESDFDCLTDKRERKNGPHTAIWIMWSTVWSQCARATSGLACFVLADPCHTTLPSHVVRAGCRRVVPSSGANGSNGLQCHHHCLCPRHNCFFKCVKGNADRRNAQFL